MIAVEIAPASLLEKREKIQDDIATCLEREQALHRKLADLENLWRERQDGVRRKLELQERNRSLLEVELQALDMPAWRQKTVSLESLQFLDGDVFQLLVSAVILANMIVLVAEVVQVTDVNFELCLLEYAFLVFYAVELVLRIIQQRVFFFCPNRKSDLFWNWLSLAIVAQGCVRLLVLPLAPSVWHLSRIECWLRMFRVVRVVRLWQTVGGTLSNSDLSWTHSGAFESFMLGVIALNSIVIGLESDLPDVKVWAYMDQMFLFLYLFELLVRMKHAGRKFFNGFGCSVLWNWLDLVLVCGSIMNQWLRPLYAYVMDDSTMVTDGGSFVILRMARLLRVLRLVRLIRSVKPLYTLGMGVAQAMQGMGWVLALTLAVIYICALLGVKLVGEGMIFSEDVPDEVRDTFPDVFNAMFNLFKVMNADFGPMSELFRYCPLSKWIIACYVIVANWAIFSILTAVVSDNMASASREADEVKTEDEHHLKVAKLNVLFDEIDTGGSGDISKREFEDVMTDDFRSQQLCDAAELSFYDLADLFHILSHRRHDKANGHHEPVITRRDFIEHLQKEWKRTPVSERAVRRLEKRLANLEEMMTEYFHRGQHNMASSSSLNLPDSPGTVHSHRAR